MVIRSASPLRLLACLGLAGLLAALPAQAQDAAASCPAWPQRDDPWPDREGSLRRHGQLPVDCLKALVLECGAASSQAFLDGGSAAQCSVRYEALLRQGFGGDFQALLVWWRERPQ